MTKIKSGARRRRFLSLVGLANLESPQRQFAFQFLSCRHNQLKVVIAPLPEIGYAPKHLSPRLIQNPADVCADEIGSLEDLLTCEEKTAFLARLSNAKKLALDKREHEFGSH